MHICFLVLPQVLSNFYALDRSPSSKSCVWGEFWKKCPGEHGNEINAFSGRRKWPSPTRKITFCAF